MDGYYSDKELMTLGFKEVGKCVLISTKTSIYGAFNVLGLAKRTGARILHTSTSEIYGDPKCSPQSESYRGNVNTIGPRSCYDEGKRAAETLFFDYNRKHDVDIKVIRIFNTYGPRMDIGDGRVVSNFIVQSLKNENITIYGDGSQTRSFCYAEDLIDGMIRMMESRDGFTGPVNLGNPEEYTMIQLAETIVKMTNSYSKIVYMPLPQDDPVQRKPDIGIKNDTCELGINFVIGKENYTEISQVAETMKSLGADHVKFAPLFSNDTEGYHKDIKDDVTAQLDELGKRLNDGSFKIIDLYTDDFDNYEVFKRTYSRCPIKEFVCIIAANSKVYYCHDKAYLSDGCVCDLNVQSFREGWYSDEVTEKFRKFDAMKTCGQHCVYDSRNILINSYLDMDLNHVNFV